MALSQRRERMPTRLGRYEVRAKIAEGGMATIYLGRLAGPAGFQRTVALKVIKDEFSLARDFVNMFLDEAKIVSKLSHPNVVQLFELGTEGNRLFIAMELLQGQSLWSLWEACRERRVRLRYDMTAWIGARVAEGLHHAHELKDSSGNSLQVVHRDVNASNIFVTYDGHVKVIDFGLAKAKNRISRTAAGIVKGKLAYMSPEQTVGKPLDRRTDIFALATTLWEITCDRRLFKGKDDVTTLTAVHEAKVPDPTTIVDGYPKELWAVLKKALERDREKRYATALEMSQALDAVSHCERRTITSHTVAEVMRALFAHERRRQDAWLAEASAAESPNVMHTLRPPPDARPSYENMGDTLEPPPGTFAPPSDDAPTQPLDRDEIEEAKAPADGEPVEPPPPMPEPPPAKDDAPTRIAEPHPPTRPPPAIVQSATASIPVEVGADTGSKTRQTRRWMLGASLLTALAVLIAVAALVAAILWKP